MLYLTLCHGKSSAGDIAQAMCIPLNTCKKNMHLLKKANLVSPYPGLQGGYTLSKEPNLISLSDIINAVERKSEINRCLENDGYCNRDATKTCPVRKVYKRVQTALDDALSITLQELAADVRT